MREETEANKGLWFAATPQVVIKQRFKQAIYEYPHFKKIPQGRKVMEYPYYKHCMEALGVINRLMQEIFYFGVLST